EAVDVSRAAQADQIAFESRDESLASPPERRPPADLPGQADDLSLSVALVLEFTAVGQGLRHERALLVVAVARHAGGLSVGDERQADGLAGNAAEPVVGVALALPGMPDLDEARALVHELRGLWHRGLAGNAACSRALRGVGRDGAPDHAAGRVVGDVGDCARGVFDLDEPARRV